jgi:4,5:9,10-diseco-3-hydroxy-5,9,17-trioxoandrosta-1(10),2-diene-4-oate hydrolase
MTAQMPEDQYINIGGTNTRYWSMGDQGSPVILIHGFGASVEIWQHNFSALSKNHRVYALDLVGFGRSDKPSGKYSSSFLLNHLNEFVTALNIERASVVGLSMGGGVSLMYTLTYPEKVEKLILVDSAGLGNKTIFSLRLMSLPILGELMTKPSRKTAYLFFKPAVLDSKILKGAFTDLYYELFSLPGAQKAMLQVLRSMCNIFGPRKDILHSTILNLGKITAPTLIVWGKQDAVLPVEQAYFAKERIPNSQLYIFDQCGHMPNFEKPEEFNRIVLEFLSK